MAKKRKAGKKKDEGQLWAVYAAVIILLFLDAFRLPVVTVQITLAVILFFEVFLKMHHKSLLTDTKFFLLLAAMLLHVVIYNDRVANMGMGRTLALGTFPALYYLLGKQLLYYPCQGKNDIRKMWYAAGAVMAGHFVFSVIEIYSFYSFSGYPSRIWGDFWTGETYYATRYSFYAVIWVSLLFYSLWMIGKKRLSGLGLLAGILMINGLNIFNQNRMHLGVLIVVFLATLVIFCIQNRNNRKIIFGVMCASVCIGLLFLAIWFFNVGNIKDIPYMRRFLNLTSNERFGIYIRAIKQMPMYLWGGRQMDLGSYGHAHNMWLQTYNDSGVIPFTLLCIFTLLNIWDCVKLVMSKGIDEEYKYMIPSVCLGFILYFMFEEGGEHYIVYYTLFAGMAAKIVHENKPFVKNRRR